MPLESTLPQFGEHPEPDTLHRTAMSGRPPLVIVAWNACVAPSSTPAPVGAMETPMSLSIVIVAVADFVASAWLVAPTCTVTGEGKSVGAVYTPVVLIVPVIAFPPAIPSTLQFTPVFVVFVTVAVNCNVFPSNTDPLVGAIDTAIGGGGGGG